MSERYHDAAWLHEQYHGNGKTQREIAEECGVSPTAIRKWMKKHGIETREIQGENHGLYGEERDEEVKEQISETMEGARWTKSGENVSPKPTADEPYRRRSDSGSVIH